MASARNTMRPSGSSLPFDLPSMKGVASGGQRADLGAVPKRRLRIEGEFFSQHLDGLHLGTVCRLRRFDPAAKFEAGVAQSHRHFPSAAGRKRRYSPLMPVLMARSKYSGGPPKSASAAPPTQASSVPAITRATVCLLASHQAIAHPILFSIPSRP